jgi:hypothetical protein
MGLSEARVDLRTRYTIEPGVVPVKVLMYDEETGANVPQSGVLVEGCYYSRNWTEVCSSSTSNSDGLANFTFPGDAAAMSFMNFRAGGPDTSYIRSSSGTELDQGRIRNIPTLYLRATEWIHVSVAVHDNILWSAPISNERVSLFMGDSDYAHETQRTDDSGVATFLLESIFWSGELITAEVGNEDSTFTQVRGEVALQEDSDGYLSGSTSLVVDRLLFSMSGTVTDVNGSAFANRSLCLITVKNGNWIRSDMTTDQGGEYIAEGLTSRDVRIEPDSCDRDYSEPVPYDETPTLSFIEGQAHQYLNIGLTQTKLVMTVTHSSPGLPAAHVPIMLVPEDQWEYCESVTYCWGYPTARSDQNGIATFYGLQPGTKYIVMFRHSNLTFGETPSNLMNLRFAEKTDSSLVEIMEANNSYSHSLSLELMPGALETPVTVSGTILGVFENLLSNVRVSYSVRDSVTHSHIMSGTTRTGENGTFSISQLPHGNISLNLSHRGFQYFSSSFSTVPGTNTYEEGVFYLRESLPGSLSYAGTLRDDAGTPIANHGLRLYGYSTNGSTTFTTTTDSAGEFSFQDLPDGYYHVSPRDWTNEYEWNGWSFELIESVENSTLFLTRVNNSPENRQGKLSGQVTEYVDSEGPESAIPVAGACVRVYEVNGGIWTRATTDANGFWQISGLKDDQDYSLGLTSCDEGSWDSDFDFENTYERLPYDQVVRATLEGEIIHEIQLKQISRPGPGEITGRVRSASTYTNLEGIQVSLYRDNGGAIIESVFTDERGEYALVNLPLGDYSINFEDTRDPEEPYMSWSSAVEIGLEPNRLNVLLELEQTVDITDPEESPGEVSGRVFDEYGHAVRNGWVMFWDPEDPFVGGYAGTDKLGQFTVRGLPLGTPLKYKISTNFDETAYALGEFTLAEGSVFGDKYLERSGEITGRVSGDSGVYAQLIHVDPDSLSQSIVDATSVNRSSGLYRFKQVPEGSYFVKLSQQWVNSGLAGLSGDGGYYGEVSSIKPVYWNDTRVGATIFDDAQPVLVPSGSRVNGINFELSPGASISGSVLLSTPDGEVPLTGSRWVTVNFYREMSDGKWKIADPGFTHVAGPYSDYKFSIPGLAAGKYKLEFIDSRSGNNSLVRSFNGGAASLAQAEPIVLGETQHETLNQIMRIAPPQASAQALDLDEIEASLLAQLEDEITISGQATAGDDLSILVGPEFAGQFVSAFANSTPAVLGGWKQVDSKGFITARIPRSVPAGSHKIAVQDSSSTVFGWAPITIKCPKASTSDAPTNLVVSKIQPKSFSLAWAPPACNGGRNITNFSVEVSTDNGTNWRSVKTKASTSRSYTVPDAKPGTRHLVRIAATNAIGDSEYLTGEVTTPATVPNAPSSLVVSDPATTGLTLSWPEPTYDGGAAISNYKVEYAVGKSNKWTAITITSSTRSLDVTSLLPNQAYRFRVSAINNAGTGPVSKIVSGTTLVDLPQAPTNLTASKVTATGASLAWKAPTNTGGARITDYEVETSSDNGANWIKVTKKTSNSTSFALTGLDPVTTYLVRVSAVNVKDKGAAVSGSFKTLAAPPGAPTNLRSTDLTGTTATITWDAPASDGGSEITNYRVEFSSNCKNYTIVSRTGSTSLTQNVSNLKPGLKYCFRVSAINARGTSPSSTVRELTTVGNAPNAPTSLRVTAKATQVTLSWAAATVTGGGPVSNYLVQYSTDEGLNWTYATKPVSTSRSLTIRNLTRSTAYIFRVYATNDSGTSPASAPHEVTTPAR